MQIFQDFFSFGKFEKSLNATFVAFVLKIQGSFKFQDFLSISLVSRIYKIILKFLANCMSKVM